METVIGHLGPAKELFSTGTCVNIALARVVLQEVQVKGPFDEACDLQNEYFYRLRYNSKHSRHIITKQLHSDIYLTWIA